MEYKQGSTMMYDCINIMDIDLLEDYRMIHIRHYAYFLSAMTYLSILSILYWSWFVFIPVNI